MQLPRAPLPRRHFLAAGAAMALARPARAATPNGVPEAGNLHFQVTRNGSQIGTHSLVFARQGGTLTVRIEAEFRVHFGPITFYRYRHQGTEIWQDDRFASLATQTNDNGTHYAVTARRTDSGVRIEATGQPDMSAPADARPLTHWSFAALGTRLFNPETGKLLHETARPLGPGMVSLADGKPIAATRFALAGEAPISDWYDSAMIWAALDATGKDGSAITYRRL